MRSVIDITLNIMKYISEICFILLIPTMCCKASRVSKLEEIGASRHIILEMQLFNKNVFGPEEKSKLKMLEQKHRRRSKKYLDQESLEKRKLDGTEDKNVCQNPHLAISDFFLENVKEKSASWYCKQYFSYLISDPTKEVSPTGVLEENRSLKYQFIGVKKKDYPIIAVLKCTLPVSHGVEYFIDAFQKDCVLWVKYTSFRYNIVSIVERLCNKNLENISLEEDNAKKKNHPSVAQDTEFKKRKKSNNVEEFLSKKNRNNPLAIKEQFIDEEFHIPRKQCDLNVIVKEEQENMEKKM